MIKLRRVVPVPQTVAGLAQSDSLDAQPRVPHLSLTQTTVPSATCRCDGSNLLQSKNDYGPPAILNQPISEVSVFPNGVTTSS